MAGMHATRLHRPAADVKAATIAAMASGRAVVHEPTYATADLSGWCETPIVIDQMGDSHRRMAANGHAVREPARTLSMAVRCRRCEGCRRETRHMWAKRAVSEWERAGQRGGRTWFVTLTFRPEEHYRLRTKTRQRLGGQGIELDALAWRERYGEVLTEYKVELDLFLDRLRKGRRDRGWAAVQFRYLAVPEPHKSGYVHYHVLIHEVSQDARLPRRRIEEAWGQGFVAARLVGSPQAALYTTKYLGKNHYEGRIRASQRYGQDDGTVPHPELADASMKGALWERERDPAAAEKADVVELREAVLPRSSECYGEQGSRDEEARLRELHSRAI